MRDINVEALSRWLQLVLQAVFVLGAGITGGLWFILRYGFAWVFRDNEPYFYACFTVLTLAGGCALYILWQLIAMLHTVRQRNPFTAANTRALTRIAVCAFVLAALFVVLMFFLATVLTFAAAFIFLLGGLCFLVLAGLFRRAVQYKAENDLTV